MAKNSSENASGKTQTPEVKKPITNEERLAAVKKQVDDKTRKDAIEKGDPIAKMKLNIAWANQYPEHELAKAIKGLANYGDLTTDPEAAKAAVAKMVEIQKKLGISDTKGQDGIVGSGTLKTFETKEKDKEQKDAQDLIAELDQSLYTPDLQKKTEQAKKEKPGVGDVLSTLWKKGGKEALNVAKDAIKGTVLKDAKGNEYRVGKGAEGQTQYTNKDGEIFEINRDNKLISVKKQAEKNKTKMDSLMVQARNAGSDFNADNPLGEGQLSSYYNEKGEFDGIKNEKGEKYNELTGKFEADNKVVTAAPTAVASAAPETSTSSVPSGITGTELQKFNEAGQEWSTIKSGDKGWKYKKIDGELFAMTDTPRRGQEPVMKLGKDNKWTPVDISKEKASGAVDIFLQKYGDWTETSALRTDKYSDIPLSQIERLDDAMHGGVSREGEKVIQIVDTIAKDMGYSDYRSLSSSSDSIARMKLGELRKILSSEENFIQSPLMEQVVQSSSWSHTLGSRGFVDPNKYGVKSQNEYARYGTITLKRDKGNTNPNSYMVKTGEIYTPIADFLNNANDEQVTAMAKNLGGNNIPGKRVIQVGDYEIAYGGSRLDQMVNK